MSPLSALLQFVVPAVVVAGVLLGLRVARARKPAPGDAVKPADAEKPGLERFVLPLLVAAAFWPADIGLNQFHAVWDKDGTKRFLAVAIAASLWGLVHVSVGRAGVTTAIRALLGAGVATIVLLPLAGGRYVPWPMFVALAAGTAAWLACVGWVLDRGDTRLPRLTVPAVLVLTAAASAPGLFLCTFAGGAALAGALASIAGGLCLARLLSRAPTGAASGASTVWLALFGSILLVTLGYTEVHAPWVLAMMAIAPLGVLAGLLPRCPWRRFATASVAAGALAGAATLSAGLAAGPASSDDDDESSYDY